MKNPKAGKQFSKPKKQKRLTEVQEIEELEKWIEFGKPNSGVNPLSYPPLPDKSKIGRLDDGDNSFSTYVGCTKFDQLPISHKTKDGLRDAKFKQLTDIQRASLPHSLCGKDILGAAKTGSGKTLAFVIPVLEKLYRARWGPEDGVGSIIISPTRELAGQLFDVLKAVGKYHTLSAGLLIGGRKDVDAEKERVNELNILICTPGRLLQHMDETPNFECSQLQVLVLDEADRILDMAFKKDLNAIISQLPKHRQTMLFSATQTKSVQDLARLSLKDPEYLSVHEESVTATPSRLQQTAMVVPLDQKMDMLWSFIKAHLNSKVLVFLSSCKQVKFVFEAFKKLRPGIPLKCLHGRMKQQVRMAIYSQFCEERSVLFCTDVASRGLDFNKAVNWVVQMDCPEDVAAYIHRVGRTARYNAGGRSVLFLMPTEMKMLEKLEAAKVPIQFIKANTKRLQPVSGLLASLLVKYPDLQHLAQRAFITYVKSIHIQRDKEIFDVMKLPTEEFSASLGLPMMPKIRFLNKKSKRDAEKPSSLTEDSAMTEVQESAIVKPRAEPLPAEFKIEEVEEAFLLAKDASAEEKENATKIEDHVPATRVVKGKKLKINIHRPVGTHLKYDEEGNAVPPLATIADRSASELLLDPDAVQENYKKMMKDFKRHDKEDKLLHKEYLKNKRLKLKTKLKRGRTEEDDDEEGGDLSGSEGEATNDRKGKKSKINFDSDNDNDIYDGGAIQEDKDKIGFVANSISLAEQEALALKLLGSMH